MQYLKKAVMFIKKQQQHCSCVKHTNIITVLDEPRHFHAASVHTVRPSTFSANTPPIPTPLFPHHPHNKRCIEYNHHLT